MPLPPNFDKHWYIQQTLLGCGPNRDINRRMLYRGMEEIVCFNKEMREWSREDDKALQKLASFLNSLEQE